MSKVVLISDERFDEEFAKAIELVKNAKPERMKRDSPEAHLYRVALETIRELKESLAYGDD
jgi:hypothetical protein